MKALLKKFTQRFNFNLSLKLNGKKFIIPIVKNIGFWHLTNKDGLWIIYLLKKLLKIKKGIFVDIGINIGQTLLAVKSVSDETDYIGFEPNPACVYYTRFLIEKNKFTGTKVISAGLFNENTLVEFDLGGEADPGGTMAQKLRPGFGYSERLTVPVFSFDSIASKLNINEISIIKIDVEGAELEVIKSMQNSISNYQPMIICEVLWTHNEEAFNYTIQKNIQIMDILNSLKYKVYQVIKSEDKNEISEFKLITQFDNQIYTNENRELCDYLFIPDSIDINSLVMNN